MAVGIVSPVRLDNFRTVFRSTYFSTYRRNPINQGEELCDIVSVGFSQNRDQRDALSIGNQVVLAAGLSPVSRIRTGFFPHLRQPESKRNQRLHGTSQFGPLFVIDQGVHGESCPILPLDSNPVAASSKSFRSRSPSLGASIPRESLFSGRTGCRSTPFCFQRVCGPDTACALASVGEARVQ